ncbi:MULTISPECIES: putative zinc-binding metallopeptidase [unclassified Paraburkholderia]|uniref:zinc-binding metallopeptidase family protein n=1 Tax=unclassified Paraburkholderia TaxID=2615204 RepID=UPI002AB323A8|nr:MULTISPECIES: putative zinc-binding metallopeptidase [unclassified Paraburkholderia]
MKTFHCDHCNQLVFFENERCERCDARLGYVPQSGEMHAFEALEALEQAGEGRWRILNTQAPGTLFRQCHNYAVENVCNGMIPDDAAHANDTLCRACQFTRTIPNLERPENRLYWYRLEVAKRRLLYTLGALGLPLATRAEDPEHGLQFEFLEEMGDGQHVLTGHDHGLITMNIAEADDAHRESTRVSLHEPYRTLLGHFRHEVGHYYFDRLVAETRWIEPFRQCFGDERADYAAALATHYANGPAPDWTGRHVSAYASVHPWEDWAETWAHYLHLVDTLDTAAACGVALLPDSPDEPVLLDQTPVDEASFDNRMARWFALTYALNSLNRSLGMPDGYPFTLAPPVIDKLRFVHRVISAAAQT